MQQASWHDMFVSGQLHTILLLTLPVQLQRADTSTNPRALTEPGLQSALQASEKTFVLFVLGHSVQLLSALAVPNCYDVSLSADRVRELEERLELAAVAEERAIAPPAVNSNVSTNERDAAKCAAASGVPSLQCCTSMLG